MLQQILGTSVIAGVSSEIEDIRNIPGRYSGLERVPVVPCVQDEIFVRLGGRSIAADIIADDAKGVLKSSPQVRLENEHVPNIKGGRALRQGELDFIGRAIQGTASPADLKYLSDAITRTVIDAKEGVWQMMNFIIWGMLSNNLAYNKDGYKVTAFNWGTPSDLIVTPGTLWTNIASTPITDVNTLVELMRVKYGIIVDRITMSTTALRNASATTQFITLATNALVTGGVATFINSSDIKTVAELAGRLWGLKVVIEDNTMDVQGQDGSITSTRYLAVNKVVLDSSMSDGNRNVMDFGSAPVTEGVVASILGQSQSQIIGSLTDGARGPVCYAEGNMNPPSISIWGVAKGFARKHKETATAVLTVA
jgi:hypothetical protein